MGYSFTIGKADVHTYGEGKDLSIYPYVTACEYDGDPSSVWVDDMGGDDATRCPSYTQWGEVMDLLPVFGACFDWMEKVCRDSGDWESFIPCMAYEHKLDDIEHEALSEVGKRHPDAAKRAMWFVKWSREAIKRYGKLAAFQRPGEW